ncbi:hypothetical protein E2C01_081751 [Portunus trituberculatus]|uniref:Uncharacterized protein n=1 Tax=Portunus trituberculatus TaxID=210409 RepID=A0A5B7ISP5_PORTR|nr:hypothetical protein [Portunus trituberculatus]
MIDWVSIVRHSRRRFSNYMYAVPTRVRRRRKRPILPSAAAAASAALAEERDGYGAEEEDGREAGRGSDPGRFHPCDLCGCLPSKHVSKALRLSNLLTI